MANSKGGFGYLPQTDVQLQPVSSSVSEIDRNKAYLIDFSKMSSVNDLMLVLSSFGFSVKGDHPYIEQLKPFLNTERPIDVQQPNRV